MKKTMKILSLLLAVLMLASTLIACGDDTPDETTPKNTTPMTTAAPITTAPETSAPETTTKAAETTTKAPETTAFVPTEAALPADPNHTEHVWYSHPTFTAYDEKQADGTIGYTAIHCRHEGCEAIKDNKVRPALVNLDFNGDTCSLVDYLTAQENVSPSQIDAGHSGATVTNGMGMSFGNFLLFSTDFNWDFNTEYYLSMDMQTSHSFKKREAHVLALGQGLTTGIKEIRFLCGLGLSKEDQTPVYINNYSEVTKIDNLEFKTNTWYRLEYVVKFGADTKFEDTTTEPGRTLYCTQGTLTAFLTPMYRTEDGEMLVAGDRQMIGTFENFAYMGDDDGNPRNFDTNIIKICQNNMIQAFDNLVVGLAEKTK